MENVQPQRDEDAADERIARRVSARDYFAALRPRQWAKNVLVLAPLVFSRNLFEPGAVASGLCAFALFCLVSSAGYLVNDIADLKRDRLHPLKRLRPVAAGRVSRRAAVALAGALFVAGAVAAPRLGANFAAALGAYAIVSLAYTLLLKRVVILDVFAIAAGFVLRAAAGALAIRVEMSGWLLICTTLLALLVAFGKRRSELLLLRGGAGGHRPVLEEYDERFLDMMIAVAAASTVMSYALYTASEETVARFGTRGLFLTLPFVLYGVFRYLYLLYAKGRGGDPVETAFGDRATFVNLLLWVASVSLVLYLR